MEDSLEKLFQLRDINLVCMGGAFFVGFGVMHSMVFNQISGLFALGNGLLPLRKVAKIRAEQEKLADPSVVV